MGVFPFINTETAQEAASQSLPLFREYAYDFENHCLKQDSTGKTYLVEGNEALRIWIYFALATARYRYTAYDTAFGSEIEGLVGQPMGDEVTQMELERYITEALMCNPYIEELSDFDFTLQRDGIEASFNCRTVYGSDRVSYEIKAVV